MERLFDWGRATGLAEIEGSVLAENRPMIAFVRALGFSVQPSADDPEVVVARKRL
jgi:acetyltransferase